MEHPVRVTIAYSHGAPETASRVAALAQRLRDEGLECRVEQYGVPPPLRLARDSTIPYDCPCTTCSYNLRGLHVTGRCPECGEPVKSTLRLAEHLIAAAEAFGLSPAGVPAMAEALRSGSFYERNAAAYALAHVGPAAAEALPELIAALRDEDNDVRWWAAFALGQLGWRAESAVPVLGDLLHDADEEVVEAAREALRRIRESPREQDAPPAHDALVDEVVRRVRERLPHDRRPPDAPQPPARIGATMRKWEYKTLKLDASGWTSGRIDEQELDRQLNDFGRQGWELVGMLDTRSGFGGEQRVLMTLKRPLE